MKYKTEVLVMGEVVRTAETDCPKEAKRIYWQTADSFEFYTQVYIDGEPITMQKANKLSPLTTREFWTLVFYDPTGKFEPESDWDSPQEAADRVHWLNGGGKEREAKW